MSINHCYQKTDKQIQNEPKKYIGEYSSLKILINTNW